MTIHIDFISDFVCPWCWLGFRRLQQAVSDVQDLEVVIKFRPFQLDASVPTDGLPYKEYMQNKFGPPSETNKWNQMREYLEKAGKEEEIPFQFSGMTIRSNTFNAHRLMRWAQGQGYTDTAAELLFDANFNAYKNIGDIKTLISIGEDIGLVPDVLEKLFHEDADKTSLQEEETFYRSLGVSGVPTIIANGRYAIQGAQDVPTLIGFLRNTANAPAQDES